MAKSVAAVTDTVRVKAESSRHYLRRIEKAVTTRAITELDAEQAYAGAFLAFHSHVENTIEYLFLGLLRGRVEHRLKSVRPLAEIASDSVATRIVFNGRSYVDWLPFSDHTLSRSKLFFSEGRPFTTLSKDDRLGLDELSVLRNALAHASGHAVRRFQKVFVEGKALPTSQKRPAGYLRGEHTVGLTRFEFLAARTARALTTLG
jgi:hypothetical protein